MACDPITVRCSCGAEIRCQHDASSNEVDALGRDYAALEADLAEAVTALEAREAAVKELGGRFIGEALTIRTRYLQQSITWCPGCGDAIRVEFLLKRPSVVLVDVEGGKAHWCPASPIAPNEVERLRACDRTPVRTAPDTSGSPRDFGVEVPRLG